MKRPITDFLPEAPSGSAEQVGLESRISDTVSTQTKVWIDKYTSHDIFLLHDILCAATADSPGPHLFAAESLTWFGVFLGASPHSTFPLAAEARHAFSCYNYLP
jgi:hypothetical protein